MDKQSITITDDTILSYYRENPHLDIVAMNLMFIDILKNLSTNLSATINSTINSKILSIVSDIDKNVSSFRSDIITNFNEKLNQTKKEYVEDLKTQLTNNILSNNEKLSSLIDRNADSLLAKTTSSITAIINDIVPKSQDKNYLQIENCIKSFCSSIEHDTKKLLETKNNDDNSSKIIIDNIESNFSKMVSSIQSPILQLIQSSEERTTGGIQKVKDEFLQQQIIQEKLTAELNDFLNKYKNNSNLKPPAPNPKTKADAGRKASFCARMEGVVAKSKGPAERAKASLKSWNC
jgi:F0F1-type ATP synthase membrane subunit b/b'